MKFFILAYFIVLLLMRESLATTRGYHLVLKDYSIASPHETYSKVTDIRCAAMCQSLPSCGAWAKDEGDCYIYRNLPSLLESVAGPVGLRFYLPDGSDKQVLTILPADPNLTWNTAKTACENAGEKLAFYDYTHDDFLDLFNRIGPFFLGAQRINDVWTDMFGIQYPNLKLYPGQFTLLGEDYLSVFDVFGTVGLYDISADYHFANVAVCTFSKKVDLNN